MATLHIEDFYKDCTRILLQLFASFPRKSSVFVEDISGADTPDEYGVHSKRFQACFGAMVWLAEEGYLRFESTIRQEAVDQATLTQKGFLMLSCATFPFDGRLESPHPTSLNSNADYLHHLLHTETSSQVADALQRLFLGA